MQSLLETYLSDVAAQLQSLPAKRREEELREMRAHLESAVAAGREQGQTDDEAARAALAQFGASEAVGRETVTAWRRGVGLKRRSFWGAAICGFGLLAVLPLLLTPLRIAYLMQFAPHNPPVWAREITTSWTLPALLLIGGIVGVFFPRRAFAGLGLAWGVRRVCYPVLITYYAAYHPISYPPGFILQMIVWTAAEILLLLLGAWAGSRWRKGQMRRMPLA